MSDSSFQNEQDYDAIAQGDVLSLPGVRAAIAAGQEELTLVNETRGTSCTVLLPLTGRQRGMVLAGGLLNYTREGH